MITSEQIIQTLHLKKHCEGGYFYRTFYSEKNVQTENQKIRKQLSSIYYLLTKTDHIGCFTKNKSDLMLYYHLGNPVNIIFLNQDGSISEKILGPDILAGQQLQIACPANICKAYDLTHGEFCLLGEAVAPGFEYEDMQMLTKAELFETYQSVWPRIEKYF